LPTGLKEGEQGDGGMALPAQTAARAVLRHSTANPDRAKRLAVAPRREPGRTG
jgi:hypothetical protein